MTVSVSLEHPVPDYDAWKAAFDADPLDRARSGVLGYRVSRRVDDPLRIAVSLDFADRPTAERFRDALVRLWATSGAMAVMSDPVIRIEDVTEDRRPGR